MEKLAIGTGQKFKRVLKKLKHQIHNKLETQKFVTSDIIYGANKLKKIGTKLG